MGVCQRLGLLVLHHRDRRRTEHGKRCTANSALDIAHAGAVAHLGHGETGCAEAVGERCIAAGAFGDDHMIGRNRMSGAVSPALPHTPPHRYRYAKAGDDEALGNARKLSATRGA